MREGPRGCGHTPELFVETPRLEPVSWRPGWASWGRGGSRAGAPGARSETRVSTGPPGSETPANPPWEAALGSTSGPRSAGDQAWVRPSRELGIPRVAEGRVGGTTAEMPGAPGRVEQAPPPPPPPLQAPPNHRHLAPRRRPAPPAEKRAAGQARPALAPPSPRPRRRGQSALTAGARRTESVCIQRRPRARRRTVSGSFRAVRRSPSPGPSRGGTPAATRQGPQPRQGREGRGGAPRAGVARWGRSGCGAGGRGWGPG